MSKTLFHSIYSHCWHLAVTGLLLAACKHAPVARSQPVPEKHQAMLSRPGSALYVDRIDNKVLMQADTASQNNFSSFRIGWSDSSTDADKRRAMEKERYFQYTMQQDWKAISSGDTLNAVFFQERPGLNDQLKEGVLVFETASGRQPDTLIYRDSFGAWGTQLFVLNRK